MKNKNIIILGGAGFVGSKIAIHLIKKKFNVSIIDGLIKNTGGTKKNVDGISHKLSHLIIEKIENLKSLNDLIDNCDVIINCIGLTNHKIGFLDPLLDIKININSHVYFLKKYSNFLKNKLIINLSSIAVYGYQTHKLIDESAICNPLDPQAINKLTTEMYYNIFANRFNFKVLNLRISSCFSERQNLKKDNGFFSFLIHNILNNKKFSIFDNLSRYRSFLYLDDLSFLIEKLIKTPPKESSLLNISGNYLSIKDVLNAFRKLKFEINYDIIKNNSEINFIDQFNYKVSDNKILNYFPNFNYTVFEKALTKVIKSINPRGF